MIALRSGRGGARLVVDGGGSWSDFGLVGVTRSLASFFSTVSNNQLKQHSWSHIRTLCEP